MWDEDQVSFSMIFFVSAWRTYYWTKPPLTSLTFGAFGNVS